MQELVFTLDKKDTRSLGTIRCMQDIKVAAGENCIWLRGFYDTGSPDMQIKQLPVQHSYHLDENNLLFTPGGLTPVALLPQLNWQPVAEFISISIPVAALPGRLEAPAVTRLIPSATAKKSYALRTTLLQWKAYAETAPATRLAQWQFAVSENNEVLIVGTPLPPLPGKEYWLTDDILLPCGYSLEIPMAAPFISSKLNPGKDGLLLFDEHGYCEKIDLAYVVPAKRSAIRLTTINS